MKNRMHLDLENALQIPTTGAAKSTLKWGELGAELIELERGEIYAERLEIHSDVSLRDPDSSVGTLKIYCQGEVVFKENSRLQTDVHLLIRCERLSGFVDIDGKVSFSGENGVTWVTAAKNGPHGKNIGRTGDEGTPARDFWEGDEDATEGGPGGKGDNGEKGDDGLNGGHANSGLDGRDITIITNDFDSSLGGTIIRIRSDGQDGGSGGNGQDGGRGGDGKTGGEGGRGGDGRVFSNGKSGGVGGPGGDGGQPSFAGIGGNAGDAGNGGNIQVFYTKVGAFVPPNQLHRPVPGYPGDPGVNGKNGAPGIPGKGGLGGVHGDTSDLTNTTGAARNKKGDRGREYEELPPLTHKPSAGVRGRNGTVLGIIHFKEELE